MNKPISVIGLGKIGTPLALALAAKGFRVMGVDIDPHRVETLNRGEAPIYEPGLEELIQRASGRFLATSETEAAVSESAVTFIATPTPSEPDGTFSLREVLPVCEKIGRVLSTKEGYHLVVLSSTVMPGATEGDVKQTLEARSKKRCGSDFGLCYSPMFFSLGGSVHGLHNPDLLLIGESDPRAGDELAEVFNALCDNDPPVARMNLINAELTKLAINTFVTTKITFANSLARLCERLPGADVDVVTRAAGLDGRIGDKFFKGAIGYGGPCFPRDNSAVMAVARLAGLSCRLAEATNLANREEMDNLLELVTQKTPQGGTVGILGLAYKPDTEVVDEAQGLLLAQALMSREIPVVAYDPKALENVRRSLSGPLKCSDSLEACVAQADVLMITTPWKDFERLPTILAAGLLKPQVIIDCWRLLDRESLGSGVEYVALGVGPPPLSPSGPGGPSGGQP